MPAVTWDHVHLRSPDPEATAAWLEDILGGEIIRSPGRIDVRLGGAMVFIAPVTAGDGVNAPPVTPYQGLDHFGLTVKDIDARSQPKSRPKGSSSPRSHLPSARVCASVSFAALRASPSSFWSVTGNTLDAGRREPAGSKRMSVRVDALCLTLA